MRHNDHLNFCEEPARDLPGTSKQSKRISQCPISRSLLTLTVKRVHLKTSSESANISLTCIRASGDEFGPCQLKSYRHQLNASVMPLSLDSADPLCISSTVLSLSRFLLQETGLQSNSAGPGRKVESAPKGTNSQRNAYRQIFFHANQVKRYEKQKGQ